jgi:acyl dehydratase
VPIDPALAVGAMLPLAEFSWTPRDVILYHLAIGAGARAPDLEDTWERRLRVIPSFATLAPVDVFRRVMEVPGLRFELSRLLHGEHELTLSGPLPTSGRVINRGRITAVQDKGTAAVVEAVVDSHLDPEAPPAFTNRLRLFVRGEGGFGGDPGPARPPDEPPRRKPSASVITPTLPQQALLYRLCGDDNPLHVDPGSAEEAGFERPILHGLCTFGIACRAAVTGVLAGAPDRVAGVAARFAGVVFPGETLVTDLWRDDRAIVLSTRVVERRARVLTHARITLGEESNS